MNNMIVVGGGGVSAIPANGITLDKIEKGNEGDFLVYDDLGNLIKTTHNARSTCVIQFDHTDKRFFSELGLPNAQGWTIEAGDIDSFSLVIDDDFDIGKQVIELNALGIKKAKVWITPEQWENLLYNGADYFFTMKMIDNDADNNPVFTGFGFGPLNDPRTNSSNRSRLGLIISEDGTHTTIQIDGSNVITLDGVSAPLVLKGEKFIVHLKVNKTPDGGFNFGSCVLRINGIIVDTGAIVNTNNDHSTNIVTFATGSSTGTSVSRVCDFGLIIHNEEPNKLLTPEEALKDDIYVLPHDGMREYKVRLPNGTPRKAGSTIKLLAKNAGGSVIFETEDLNNPECLFNGVTSYEIPITEITEMNFVNTIFGNAYESPKANIEDNVITLENMAKATQGKIIGYGVDGNAIHIDLPDTSGIATNTADILSLTKNNADATAPATTYAYMWWADTTNDLLKQRNAANDGWIDILTLSTGEPVALPDTSGIATNTADILSLTKNNADATEPTTTYAYMWWADTTNDLLKQRNAANDGWIDILTLSTGEPVAVSVSVETVELHTSATASDTIDIPVAKQYDYHTYGFISTQYGQYYEIPKLVLENIATYKVDSRGYMMGSSSTGAGNFTFIKSATFDAGTGALTQVTCDTGGDIYSVFGKK